MPSIRVLLLLAAVGLPVACAKIESDKKSMALEAAVNGYRSALRWGYFETASGYVHPDQREDLSGIPWLDNVRVTGYDVVQPAVLQDEDRASQVVRIEYLHQDTQRIHRLVDRQTWRYDDESGNWWLYSGLPPFK